MHQKRGLEERIRLGEENGVAANASTAATAAPHTIQMKREGRTRMYVYTLPPRCCTQTTQRERGAWRVCAWVATGSRMLNSGRMVDRRNREVVKKYRHNML